MAQYDKASSRIPSCDAYFEAIQSKKRLPHSLQESLTAMFAQIPASSFPYVPGGKVIEIPANKSVIDAVRILSEHNIMAAPVKNPEAGTGSDWRERYVGIIDYHAIIFWVLQNAELAAVALSAGSATAAGVGAGALGALGVGAVALGATGPLAVAGLIFAAVGAAVAGGLAAEEGMAKDAPTAADHLGEDFYKALLQEEPFKSTTVGSIVKSYHWAPFLPVGPDSSMLTVLLLLSKYGLRNVPLIEVGKASMKNFITQSAVVQCLRQCKGNDCFDQLAVRPLSDFGLPFMSNNEVISIKSDELILEAFKRMNDNYIGGLPVIEGPKRKIVGSVCIGDIKFLLLRPGLFSNFSELTAIDFVKTIGSSNATSGYTSMVAPVICAPNASLGSVIDNLASRLVHRVYIAQGDDPEVTGVVTLRDVISCFIYEPPDHFDNCFGLAMKERLNHLNDS